MLRVSRWALTALLTLILSTVPFGASWADPGRGDGRDDPPAHGREKEHENQDESTDEDSTTEESPDEQQEGAEQPQSTESGEEGSGGDGSRAKRSSEDGGPEAEPSPQTSPERGRASGDVVDASFSASPASISIGEASTLQVSVTNPTDTPAGDVELLVDLPTHLELRSSHPQATGSDVLTLSLGDIAPAGSVSATVVVVGVAPTGDLEPVRFALMVDGETFHHELQVEIADDGTEGLGLVQSSPLLLQVGDAGSFSATLSNSSEDALEDVAVVTRIAPELDVVGVTPIVEADAIQLGASPRGEDIVWIFESLAPGEEVNLTWTARAVAPGDLEAGNVIDATVAGQPVASSSQGTYLGYVRGVRTERSPSVAPVVRERVVTKLVPVTSQVAGAVGGGILPVTGWSPALLGSGGALLIGLGALFLWASKGLRSRRLALVLVGALLLTATACVSDDGSSGAPPGAATSPSAEATDQEGDEEEDEVLGLRIKKPQRDEPDDPTTPPVASEAPAPPVAPTEPVTEVVYEEVSEVVTVVVPVEDLPVTSLGDREGDNTFSFSWTPESGDLQATSGRTLTADATEELLVGLSSAGDTLTATVTVTNLAGERRLHVGGRLALHITAGDGRTSSLVSDPIDVVLEPGASTVAQLAFSLPSGDYLAKGAFVTD